VVKAIRKLALGFQLVCMGYLLVVVGLVISITSVFVLPEATKRGYISIETMKQLATTLPVAMSVCILIGYLMGIAGRYICVQSPEIAGETSARIRASFAVEVLELIVNMVNLTWLYLIPALVSYGILPELFLFRQSLVLFFTINIGFFLGIASNLYFVIYARDLADFVGSDNLSNQSEMARRLFASILVLVFTAIIMTAAVISFGMLIDRLDIWIVLGTSCCALGLIYVVIAALSILVFVQYLSVLVAMPSVLKAYDGPTDTQNGPSE